MQTRNINVPIIVTGRHVSVTEAMRDYANKKIENLHLDYPKIIEAKVILDVDGRRQSCEILLACANHIHIEAKAELEDVYASIDEATSRIARRMRKFKTRMMKRTHRPRRDAAEAVPMEIYNFGETAMESEQEDIEPVIVHPEAFKVRPLYPDEAIMDLEMSERNFVIFHNQKSNRLAIVYRRKDGDYAVIEPRDPFANGQTDSATTEVPKEG